jgi:hypothetical protein
MYKLSISGLIYAAIQGALIGAIFIGLSHIMSRPIGATEVNGAAISAAVLVTFLKQLQS